MAQQENKDKASVEAIYQQLFRNYREVLRLNASAALDGRREAAFETFCRQGFPAFGSGTSEAYRHLDLSEALSVDYGMNLYRMGIPAHPGDVFRCDVPSLSTRLYFIVNDQYYPSKKPVTLPEGVLCGSLNTLLGEHPELGAKYYDRLRDDDGLAALNTAFVQDGFLLYVPAGVKLDKPLQLIQMFQGEIDILANRRLLVVLEAGASATLMVCDHAITSSRYLSNQVAEIHLGEGASLDYCELEMTHDKTVRLANTYVRQAAGSSLRMNAIGLENGLTRNNLTVSLCGRDARADLSGLNLLSRSQVADNHILVDHSVPGCHSNQLYKYILDDRAHGVFGGKVLVRPDAQQTESYQSNANLVTSDQARMNALPQLEIYADDVQCSHGSATGQLDANALFYMRQRGLDEDEARQLLKFAFTADVVERIAFPPLKDRIKMLVGKRFRGELAKCIDCKICP